MKRGDIHKTLAGGSLAELWYRATLQYFEESCCCLILDCSANTRVLLAVPALHCTELHCTLVRLVNLGEGGAFV